MAKSYARMPRGIEQNAGMLAGTFVFGFDNNIRNHGLEGQRSRKRCELGSGIATNLFLGDC